MQPEVDLCCRGIGYPASFNQIMLRKVVEIREMFGVEMGPQRMITGNSELLHRGIVNLDQA